MVGPAGPAWARSPRNAESASWSPSRGGQVVSRSYKDASRASSLGGNGSVDPRGQQLGTPPGVHVTTALAPPLRPVPTYKQTPSALGFLTKGCNWQLPGAKRNPHCVAFGLQSIYNCNNKFDLVANVFKSGNFILEKKNPDFWLLLKKKNNCIFCSYHTVQEVGVRGAHRSFRNPGAFRFMAPLSSGTSFFLIELEDAERGHGESRPAFNRIS